MDLKSYFDTTKGFGVLATSDDQGRVNTAVYSRPHVMDDGSLAFIMNDRRSHANLQSNPNASFLFRAGNEGYQGKRLYLMKIREEQDSDLLMELKRRNYPPEKKYDGPKFLVFFKLAEELPLIGPGKK